MNETENIGLDIRNQQHTLREFINSLRRGRFLFQARVSIISSGCQRYRLVEYPDSINNGGMIGVELVDKPARYEFDIVHVPMWQHLDDLMLIEN